jgi:RNA polymerase sigma-70 factor (ECF subfamily)
LVFGVALRIVADSGEAEEVVQTVFLDIFRALANFDRRKGTLRTWLLQCAYGRALNRRRHLAANHFYDSTSLPADTLCPLFSSIDADYAELSRFMEELLAVVSPRRRAVVELTYFEGLSAGEIAGRLAVSVDVVRHELYRGLAKLRQAATKSRSPLAQVRKSQGRKALAPDAQPL